MRLIKNLEKEWDMILFDSPPLVAVMSNVSKAIDSIIIVVKVGQTDKKAFEHTIKSLRNVSAPLQGVILNAVTQKKTAMALTTIIINTTIIMAQKETSLTNIRLESEIKMLI